MRSYAIRLLIEKQLYTCTLGSIPLSELLLTKPHHQRYLRFFHFQYSSLLLVNMRSINNYPLQPINLQCTWKPSVGFFRRVQWFRPSSIKAFNLCGVPTAIPVLVDLRNFIESWSLMCFAKSLATVASFVWNFLTSLNETSETIIDQDAHSNTLQCQLPLSLPLLL
jgi:hypothetical protein